MQSNLLNIVHGYAVFPELKGSMGQLTKLRLNRLFSVYAILYTIVLCLYFFTNNISLNAFARGLLFPGAGFLTGWHVDMHLIDPVIIFFTSAIAFWILALLIWFATGNVLLPPLVWLFAAAAASYMYDFDKESVHQSDTGIFIFSLPPIFLLVLYLKHKIGFYYGQKQRILLNEYLASSKKISAPVMPESRKVGQELSLSELQHMRLLLDRALQPVECFDGFERLDQFQTAALRYQINFISYALSFAQFIYLPAFNGYLSEAQNNLRLKQENHQIWKYWALENLWGNLSNNPDPIVRDNIMYSGFVAAQLSYAYASNDKVEHQGLDCIHPKGSSFRYSYSEMVELLVRQYKNASYGLLPCEPNWVYPLCNTITATAIRTHDSLFRTEYWSEVSERFQHTLETEFITPNGQIIPFRSNYTGLAAPQIGGAVMQALPCFFLNALFPDIAERQWLTLKKNMQGKSWRSALWPVDVGNYKFSRASSYAATALAAREVGDHEIADLLLEYLDDDCPSLLVNGVAHHSQASLWANSNAFMARINNQNSLRDLVTKTPTKEFNPYLKAAKYADILVAKASYQNDCLQIVLYPTSLAGIKHIEIGGLQPNASYKVTGKINHNFQANGKGSNVIQLLVEGRTFIQVDRIL